MDDAPGPQGQHRTLSPPVLNFISKVVLARLAENAGADPIGTSAELATLLERLRGEVSLNPGLATPRCEGMNVEPGDSRLSPLYRNDVAVVAETVTAMLVSMVRKLESLEDVLPGPCPLLLEPSELRERILEICVGGDGGGLSFPGATLACPESVVVPADLGDRVSELVGTPITDEDATRFCRTYLLAKGADADRKAWLLMLGRLVAWEAHLRVAGSGVRAGYEYTSSLRSGDQERIESERLARIITAFTRVCTFERKRDLFLSQILRTKLYSERIALLGWSEPPMRQVPAQFGDGDETNQLVKPYVDITPEDRVYAIDFSNDTSVDAFVFTTSVLQEMLDMDNIRIFANTEVPFSETDTVPQPFVICSNFVGLPSGFGVVHRRRLSVVDPGSDYPICATLLDLVRRRIRDPPPGTPERALKSFKALLQCCEDDHPPVSNVFLKYLDEERAAAAATH